MGKNVSCKRCVYLFVGITLVLAGCVTVDRKMHDTDIDIETLMIDARNQSFVQQDIDEAKRLYEIAANRNYEPAQEMLARLYSSGIEINRDYRIASYWYLKSAKNGNPNSQYQIGKYYSMGYGVPRDKRQAFDWYLESAKQGNMRAQNWIARYYNSGEAGVIPKCRAWAQLAWKQGAISSERERCTQQLKNTLAGRQEAKQYLEYLEETYGL